MHKCIKWRWFCTRISVTCKTFVCMYISPPKFNAMCYYSGCWAVIIVLRLIRSQFRKTGSQQEHIELGASPLRALMRKEHWRRHTLNLSHWAIISWESSMLWNFHRQVDKPVQRFVLGLWLSGYTSIFYFKGKRNCRPVLIKISVLVLIFFWTQKGPLFWKLMRYSVLGKSPESISDVYQPTVDRSN